MTRAQKAAFNKMRAGLARYRKGLRRGSKRARVRVRRRRRAAPVNVIVRNPRKRSRVARVRRRRSNPKGAISMARRKRRRRRHATTAIMVNPRHRRRRHRMRHRRRRNPSGFIGRALSTAIPATLVAGGLALADTKLMADKSPAVRIGVKLAVAGLGAFALRRRPELASVVIASVFASVAYDVVTKMAGGVVAPNTVQAAAQLKQLVLEDPAAGRAAMGVLVEGPRMSGMGARLDNSVSLSGPIEQGANVLPPGGHFQQVSLG